MALIIYPNENWNSFITVLDADLLITGFVDSVGKTSYEALDSDGKEAILKQSTLQIKLKNCKLPDTLESNLEYAECYQTVHALTVDTMSYDPNSKSISSESVGELSVTYNTNYKDNGTDVLAPIVEQLLANYSCNIESSSFGQVYRAT